MHIHHLGLTALALAGCRSAGDFRVRQVPDPVPREARTGQAHFTYIVDSVASRPVRVGREGPWLAPGGRVRLARDLAAGQVRDALSFYRADGTRIAELRLRVRSLPPDPDEEKSFPLPDLGGRAAVVTAGFHAANHREPGHRRALDLVPRGVPALGTPVRSPFAGRVLAASTAFPDVPGGRPNELVVTSDDGRVWRFSHFQKDSVELRPGEAFRKGALLGRIGLSGATGGPHLHVELLGAREDG